MVWLRRNIIQSPSAPQRDDTELTKVPVDVRLMVCAEGVRKSFGRLEILKGIDLAVSRGEVLCIIGPSGSGKSTSL